MRSSTEQGKLLTPFQRKLLQQSLQSNLRPEQRRRIEIMLLADRGKSQAQICTALNCSQETARYWISIAQMGQAHKWQDSKIGRPKVINDQYLIRLKELVESSPSEFGYDSKRWTGKCLSQHLAREFGIKVSERHILRLLKEMGFSTLVKDSISDRYVKQSKSSGIVLRDLNGSSATNSACFALLRPN
jgi:transposase